MDIININLSPTQLLLYPRVPPNYYYYYKINILIRIFIIMIINYMHNNKEINKELLNYYNNKTLF